MIKGFPLSDFPYTFSSPVLRCFRSPPARSPRASLDSTSICQALVRSPIIALCYTRANHLFFFFKVPNSLKRAGTPTPHIGTSRRGRGTKGVCPAPPPLFLNFLPPENLSFPQHGVFGVFFSFSWIKGRCSLETGFLRLWFFSSPRDMSSFFIVALNPALPKSISLKAASGPLHLY